MKKTSITGSLTLLICAFTLSLTAQKKVDPPAKTDKKEAKEEKEDEKKKEDKKKEKSIADVTKTCHKKDGLFPIYQDSVKGNVFMEIRADQLNKEYLHFFHSENGSLNAGWVKGNYGWESIFKIKKYFDRLEFAEQNLNFYFDENNALSKSANANINEPIFKVEKIVAQSVSKDTFLIAVDGLYKSEAFAQLKYSFPPGSGPKNPFKLGGLSKDKTKVVAIKNYPKNTDVVVDYVYSNSNPTNYGLPTVTDARYSTIQVQHSIIELPENDYQPRYEDPRVGHFTTEVTDQTSTDPTPYRDMIHRWHLVKKNPGAAMSEPVEPITFWMENTTPVEIRPIIKDGVERWNRAFEKAGFKNAVVVKQQPDDADWDAGDIRYNVLRWTAAPFMGSAWGPSMVNPRTGQILAADIMLDYTFIRGIPTETATYGIDSRSLDEMMFSENQDPKHLAHKHSRYYCEANKEAANKLALGRYIAKSQDFDVREVKRMEEENLIELLLHEVGHTLGLAHNYISSQMLDANQVHDRSLTESTGLTSSVMDYNPMNLAPNKADQGNYQSVTPGPYDLWAIEYAYSEAASDEMSEQKRLDKILSRSTEDALRFGNDADAMFGSTSGIDPRINAWDMSNNPVQYSADRIGLTNKALAGLMDRMVKEGDTYHEFYRGYRRLLADQIIALRAISRYIGGVQIDRNLHGQKADGQPFTPVSYQDQKKAMNLIAQHGFHPNAFAVSKETYSHLQNQRRGWNFWGQGEDPKILARIGSYQRTLLSHLIHPNTLTRLNNSRNYGNAYSSVAMLTDLTDAIFSADLKGAVNPARQNLQQTYVDGLIRNIGNGRYDQISKSAFFQQLLNIETLMSKNKGKDLETQAHRKFIQHKIAKAMDAD